MKRKIFFQFCLCCALIVVALKLEQWHGESEPLRRSPLRQSQPVQRIASFEANPVTNLRSADKTEHSFIEKIDKPKKRMESPYFSSDIAACVGPEVIQKFMALDPKKFIDILWSADPTAAQFFEDGWTPERRDVEQSQRTRFGRLSLALGISGLLLSNKVFDRNYPKAEALLEELIQEDPQNIAMMVFRALVAAEQNDELMAEIWLQRSLAGTYFDTYFTEASIILRVVRTEPALFFYSASLWGQIPAIDFGHLYRFLKTKGPRIKLIAEAMIRKTIQLKGQGADIDWSILQYAIARSLLGQYTKTNQAALPNYMEVIESADKRHLPSFLKAGNLLVGKQCDLKVFMEYLRNI